MRKIQPDRTIGRREFLRALGGAAAAAAFGAACRLAGGAGRPARPTHARPSFLLFPRHRRSPRARPTMIPATPTPESLVGRVALIRTTDRAQGVRRALDLLGINPVEGKTVFLKPNFNSADPAPGSTHTDTLRALVERLWAMGAGRITLGDRSGMGDTRGRDAGQGRLRPGLRAGVRDGRLRRAGRRRLGAGRRARQPLAPRLLAGPPGRRSRRPSCRPAT